MEGCTFLIEEGREEVKERLVSMLASESKYSVSVDYLNVVQRDGMKAVWRSHVFEWLLEFVDEFGLNVSTVATAMNYVDRYLCHVSTKRTVLQLVALSAILVASKLHESKPLSVGQLQSLAEGIYLESDIRLMELELLTVIRWDLHVVTPFCVLRHLVTYFDKVDCRTRERVLGLSETFVEIMLCEYTFVQYLASECAIASLLCAFDVCSLTKPDLSNQLLPATLVNSGRIAECKSKALFFIQQVFPEFFRSKVVVSPDCVMDTPDSDVDDLFF